MPNFSGLEIQTPYHSTSRVLTEAHRRDSAADGWFNRSVLEAKSLDDLATQLRERFPDEACERRLRRERDREAKSVGQMP
jgi:hypothetical protein